SSGNKNGYLTHFGENWQQPCPLQRILMVDSFIVVLQDNSGIIDTTKTLLGDTTMENLLLDFADTNQIKYLVLFGTNWIFEPPNHGKTINGIDNKTQLNRFLTKAKRKGIHCAMASSTSASDTAYIGASNYNLTDSMMKYNYNLAGKLSFLYLEHEFWNSLKYTAYSGNTANLIPKSISKNLWNDHFVNVYNDHKNILDTLQSQRYKDANFRGVHDYIDKLWFIQPNDSVFTNAHIRSDDSARLSRAIELETRSNAIFLTHYKNYWPDDRGIRFLTTNYPDTRQVNMFRERLSFFGNDTSRDTYIFPTFSGEWFDTSLTVHRCGSQTVTTEGRHLGSYFQNTTYSNNNFNHVEDTFIVQYQICETDTFFPRLNRVRVSGFGWFPYHCLKDELFSNTDLHECLPHSGAPRSANGYLSATSVLNNKNDENWSLKIYPNPSQIVLNLESSIMLNEIILLDLSGRVLIDLKLNSKDVVLGVDNISRGVHFIQVLSDEGVKTLKIIKQ
ncbi:MAG: T9SS type A sorting domain-containing protein, partial [Flavobacteriales bacterium]|nr:T9SS type A sorting domain-containing protein [Flavobacteriales bacterium]